MLAKVVKDYGWMSLATFVRRPDARRHTKNFLHSLRKAILRFGWSWGEKDLVWVGELIRCRVGKA
jgi:hypothetical protein